MCLWCRSHLQHQPSRPECQKHNVHVTVHEFGAGTEFIRSRLGGNNSLGRIELVSSAKYRIERGSSLSSIACSMFIMLTKNANNVEHTDLTDL
jgi:hypothetical protein